MKKFISVILCVLMLVPYSASVCVGDGETGTVTVIPYGGNLLTFDSVLLYSSHMSEEDIGKDISENGGELAVFSQIKGSWSSHDNLFSLSDVPYGEYLLVIAHHDKVYKIIPVTVDRETVELGEIRIYSAGDVNMDFKINLMDVSYILKHCANWSTSVLLDLDNADVNRDGNVNLLDASKLLKYCAGFYIG